jgi:hypothetical protein
MASERTVVPTDKLRMAPSATGSATNVVYRGGASLGAGAGNPCPKAEWAAKVRATAIPSGAREETDGFLETIRANIRLSTKPAIARCRHDQPPAEAIRSLSWGAMRSDRSPVFIPFFTRRSTAVALLELVPFTRRNETLIDARQHHDSRISDRYVVCCGSGSANQCRPDPDTAPDQAIQNLKEDEPSLKARSTSIPLV